MANLAELVVSVSRRLGDCQLLVASSAGTTSTFVDTTRVSATRRHLIGAQLFFYDQQYANFGQFRFISGVATSTISVSPVLATAPAINSVAAVVNARGKGFEVEDISGAINDVISRLRGTCMERIDASELDDAFDVATGTVELPEGMNELYLLEAYRTGRADWIEIPKARSRGGYGWSVDDSADGIVRIEGPGASDVDACTIRAWGYGYQLELGGWSDELAIAETPVIEGAVMQLTKAFVDRENRNSILFGPNKDDYERAVRTYRTVRRRGSTLVRT